MEENKVATKLKQIVHDSYWGTNGETCRGHSLGACNLITDAILQSPDLRVTLVIHPTPIAEMIEGLRRCALLSPSESVILDILERMKHD